MRSSILVVALLALGNTASIEKPNVTVRYDNCKVYQLYIDNQTQLANNNELNDKNAIDNFLELLQVNEFEPTELIGNVQDLIDAENNYPLEQSHNSFTWTRYHTLDEIYSWLDGILRGFPTVAEGFVIGKSYEARDIRGIKISYKSGNPGIFIESNIHAREWITSATATWFINELLTSVDPDVRDLAENYDWYIVPVLNVDGFVFTRTDRLWRKSRKPTDNPKCIGADMNRNFDSHWMESNGTSAHACHEMYAGSAPFSESESKALAHYVASIKSKLKMYLSFHSYGQYVLLPYGHTNERPDNYDDLMAVAGEFVQAVAALPYGTKYRYGSISSTMYYATGTSQDWAYSTQGIKLAFTFEFRDAGLNKFVLPPNEIIPNCEELRAGMIALMAKAMELNYFN